MDKVIEIIRSNSKLKGKPSLKKLRDAGIEAGNTTLYKVISAARKLQEQENSKLKPQLISEMYFYC